MTKPIERKVVFPTGTKHDVESLAKALQQLAEAHNYHDDQMNGALRGGTSASNNAKVRYVTVSVQMPADAPWRDLVLVGTWAPAVSYQPPQYLMLPGGEVRTRGDVDTGGAGHVTDLPLGYAPPADTHLPCGSTDAAPAYLLVTGGAIAPGIYASGFAGVYSLHAQWIASPNAAPPHAFPAPWPVVVQHGFTRCFGLSVEACREETQDARSTCGAPVVDWEDLGNGQLRVNGVWGLCWGKRYSLRLRLSAEEKSE